MKGFIGFIREQGVVGLAVGFILGGAVTKVVTSLVSDIINPLLGIVLGAAGDVRDSELVISGAHVKYGNFLSVLLDFLIISFVVYFIVSRLGIVKIGKNKKK